MTLAYLRRYLRKCINIRNLMIKFHKLSLSLSLSLSSLRKYKIELSFSFYLCPFVVVRFNYAGLSVFCVSSTFLFFFFFFFCKRNKDAVAQSRFDIQIRVNHTRQFYSPSTVLPVTSNFRRNYNNIWRNDLFLLLWSKVLSNFALLQRYRRCTHVDGFFSFFINRWKWI